MSDEVKNGEEQQTNSEAVKSVENVSPAANQAPQIVYKNRSGFMGGGGFLTGLFLVAFFLVSFYSGYITSEYNKLAKTVPNVQAQTAGGQAAGQQAAAQGLQDGAQVTKKIEIDERRVKGDKNAKVTIIEFSDFECPFCGKFYSESYKKVLDKYVSTGKAKIAFKDFPLSFHPQAQKSAEASRCALEQNKFWEMHDKMFENQKDLNVDNLKKWAAELGMKADQFNQCLDSSKYAEDVKKDLNEGLALGVQGTPTFIINGEALVGAYPIEQFEKIIDSKLK